MRISGGKHLNRRINVQTKDNKNIEYRPTSDRTRQAVFNILENSPKLKPGIIENADVLDLCCGSGAFSLEAISRGASSCTMVDIAREQLNLAYSNAKLLGEENKCTTLRYNASNISSLAGKSFNLIFVDPPYGLGIEIEAVKQIIANNLLKEQGVIVLEVAKKAKTEIFADLQVVDQRIYGRTKILLLSTR